MSNPSHLEITPSVGILFNFNRNRRANKNIRKYSSHQNITFDFGQIVNYPFSLATQLFSRALMITKLENGSSQAHYQKCKNSKRQLHSFRLSRTSD